MVKIIFFDTETTGLPKNKNKTGLESSNNWPDLVSICWMIYEDKKLVRTENHIISPEGWTIPLEASRIHKITNEIAHRDGKPLIDILALFKYDIEKCYRIIAHNLHFDKNVLFHAYKWRLGIDPMLFWPTHAEFCSAKKSTNEMKLASAYPKPNDPYKIPSLKELYENTFHKEAPTNAHNAERDVEVLQQIVWKRWDLLAGKT